ncbi:unnamed protein product [Ectocarpus sp. CCAP 1310/34]|nr:unnamed protein product [Ectocarpus sp. CCAP 1310/34]
MMDKDALISSLATREAVGQGRHEPPLPPPPPPDPSFGGRGSGGAVGAGGAVVSGWGESQHGFAAKFATREDVDAALRAERPPDKMPDLPHCLASDLRVPKTFKEAMRSQHLWDDAVGREFFGLLDADEYGWPTKFKARLVARGDMQRASIDFGELFAPTVSVSSVRLLAALACEQNLDLCHFDIQQAFVQSELEEDVFMRLPQGCGWLSGLFVELFQRQKERCDKFGSDLNEMVPVKNLGELRWYSARFYQRGLERGLSRISQQRFAEELAAEYGVEWGKSVPLPVSVKLTDFDENEACADVPFRELVGSLMWLATQTRPDIANAVRAVARYCASPKMVHWKAALGILGYVRRTSWMGITFERGVVTGMSMQVFVDADYASKAADRRSVSKGLVMCGGGCVTWFSRTQKCVTLS